MPKFCHNGGKTDIPLPMSNNPRLSYYIGLALFWTVFIWSGIYPKDYPTWILETLPAVIGIIIVISARRRFPLTPLAYWLIIAHSVILMIGGHYTYAEVPLFDAFKEIFGFERNNYDKLGHFMQGFNPAIVAREILIRNRVFRKPPWMNFMIVCFCLALAAFYEMLEWWTALLSEDAAEAFLGTQGYVWDTQSDMAWALLGALLALIALHRLHDRQLTSLADGHPISEDNKL
jgi:putative membrane protein